MQPFAFLLRFFKIGFGFIFVSTLFLTVALVSLKAEPTDDDKDVVIKNDLQYMTEEERKQWQKELGRAKKTVTAVTPPVEKAIEKEEKRASEIADQSSVKGCQSLVNSYLKETPIEFLPGRYTLAKSDHGLIKDLAKVLQNCKTAKIIIEGHTDSLGQPDANQRLSGERADSVRRLLISSGIEKKRVRAIGYGAEKPLVDNDTVENRALNRRIELKLY